MSDESPNNAPRGASDLLIAVGLVVFIALVFGQTIQHGFIGYDDSMYVTDNPIVQRGLTLAGVRWAFAQSYQSGGSYTPLTFLSHMLDCQLFGLRPGMHHLTSVALHAANSVMLYFVLLALTGPRRRWESAFVAALFAVHPLHVESVAWIAERKDVLCGFFFMACLAGYLRYVRRPSAWAYLFVLAAFVLGLLSKPMLVTIPAVLLLLDYWPLGRRQSLTRLLLEKVPMIVIALGAALLTIITQKQGGFVRSLDQFPLGFRIANAVVAYCRYLGKTVWPVNLAVFYPPPGDMHWPIAIVLVCAAALVAITVAALLLRRQAPYFIVGWLWFVGMLIPVIGLVQVGRQALADRYSYLPQIGLFIIVAWAGSDLIRSRRAAAMLAAIALLACLARSVDQVRYWRDTDTLFAHAAAVTPENAVTLNEVGNTHARQHDLPGAEDCYRRALELDPNYGMAHLNLGNLLIRRRDFAGAAEHFEAALRWRAELPRAELGVAVARTGLKQYDLADRAFAEALRQSPGMADVELSWGLSFKERGDLESARSHLNAALALNPRLDLARAALESLGTPKSP